MQRLPKRDHAALQNISQDLQAWFANPSSVFTQQALFAQLRQLYDYDTRQSIFTQYTQLQGIDVLLEVSSFLVEKNIQLRSPHHLQLYEVIVSDIVWPNLLKNGNDSVLLSTLLTLSTIKDPSTDTIEKAKNIISFLTKRSWLDNENYNLTNVATQLYGEAWALLYADEVGIGFVENYTLINKLSPKVLVATKMNSENVNLPTLPSDLS